MAVRQSLGAAVVKWLNPTSRQTVRVVTVHRAPSGRIASVFIEAQTADGPRALFFFRHPDRGWQVFPPDILRPSMGAARVATSI